MGAIFSWHHYWIINGYFIANSKGNLMSYERVSSRLVQTIIEIYPNQKFNDGDMIFDWIDSAIDYMKENIDNETANDFIQAMFKAYTSYGHLTKGQLRGLLNCIRAEVLAADKNAGAVITQITTGEEPLDLRSIPSGRYAVPHEDTTAFYIIDNIQDDKSKWNNWIFVNILASDTKIKCGSQRPGQTYQGKHENLLRKILKNPYEAAVLFGKLIGKCSICGRTLTDPESIELGIGPICLQNTGWGQFERDALKALGYDNLIK